MKGRPLGKVPQARAPLGLLGIALDIAARLEPEPPIGVVEWNKKHRRIEAATVKPGPWDPSDVPYVIEPLEALTDPLVSEVVCPWGAQVGKTENLQLGFKFYILATRRDNVMFLLPDEPTVKRIQKRVHPSLKGCASLWDRVKHNERQLLTFEEWNFLSNKVLWTAAASKSGTVSAPICYLLADETDLMSPDDIERAAKRLQSYGSKARTLKTSTPTTEDGPIWSDYKLSSQKQWEVPCLDCGEFGPYEWANMKWESRHEYATRNGRSIPDRKEFASLAKSRRFPVWYECPRCGHRHRQDDRGAMNARGRYKALNPDSTAIQGFHVNSLASPFWDFHLGVHSWYKAQGNDDSLKEFYNQTLALPHIKDTARATELQVAERVNPLLERGVVPAWAALVTAGFDVQGDRIVWSVWAWSADMRRGHLMAHGAEWGDNFTGLAVLRGIARRRWPVEGGKLVARVTLGLVDCGFAMHEITNWSLSNSGPDVPIYPVRGKAAGGAPFAEKEQSVHGRGAVRVIYISADHVKTSLFSVFQDAPGLSFCEGTDHEFAREFVAEARVPETDKKGFTKQVWRVRAGYKANHLWDTAVYAYAAGVWVDGQARPFESAAEALAPSDPSPALAAPPKPGAPSRGDYFSDPLGRGLF